MKILKQIISSQQQKEIAKKYREGSSSVEISKEYDCTPRNIRYILKKLKVKMRNPKKALAKKEKVDIIKLHHAGYLVMEIAREVGRDHKSVRRVLKDNGLDIVVQRKHLSKSEIKKAKRLYLAGQSRNTIGEKLGVSGTTISQNLKSEGIKMRDRSHRNRRYDINENYFDNIDSEEKAYIVGFILADGCNYPPTNQVKITINERDIDVLKKIRRELETNIPFYYPPNKNQVNLTITNEHISLTLNDLGIVQNKTHKVVFPEWLDKDLYSHFIRGYFDGDGHIGIYNRNGKIDIVGTKKFTNKLKKIFKEDLDIHASISQVKNSFRLQIGGNIQVSNICDYLWGEANIYLDRKYQIYNQFIDFYSI